MKVTDFDFSLPKDLIARRPLKDRVSSRLLVLHRNGLTEHRYFSELPSYLSRGDMLLINNTKVFPARLTGFKKNGDMIDILLVRKIEDDTWEVLSKGGFTGTLKIANDLEAEIINGRIANFKRYTGDFMDCIWKYGNMPLPPYIKRLPDELDKESYQTVFAKKEGSIAAPTAGLHFTDSLFEEIISKGVILRELTLHVGTGTFRPIRKNNLEDHSMDAEYFEIDKGLIHEIKQIKASGKRIFAVGTTTTRAIEGLMSGNFTNNINPPSSPFLKRGKGKLQNLKVLNGKTNLFIYPGYKFLVIDSLITNFHLPKSTPLMLTSAFCGWESLMKAYKEAIAERYRFLSYGDAMLIL
jgi:S-adenosylmethionine:tRNA ribosyltransferase-isomerase